MHAKHKFGVRANPSRSVPRRSGCPFWGRPRGHVRRALKRRSPSSSHIQNPCPPTSHPCVRLCHPVTQITPQPPTGITPPPLTDASCFPFTGVTLTGIMPPRAPESHTASRTGYHQNHTGSPPTGIALQSLTESTRPSLPTPLTGVTHPRSNGSTAHRTHTPPLAEITHPALATPLTGTTHQQLPEINRQPLKAVHPSILAFCLCLQVRLGLSA